MALQDDDTNQHIQHEDGGKTTGEEKMLRKQTRKKLSHMPKRQQTLGYRGKVEKMKQQVDIIKENVINNLCKLIDVFFEAAMKTQNRQQTLGNTQKTQLPVMTSTFGGSKGMMTSCYNRILKGGDSPNLP